MIARSRTWYGSPGSPVSSEVTSALVTRPRPEEFIPVLASRPASTTVTKSGASSWRDSSTTTVSAVCGSQSQFCPSSVGPGRPGAGATANALHSGGPVRAGPAPAAAFPALAADTTPVRTLIAGTAAKSNPAPSATPPIASTDHDLDGL